MKAATYKTRRGAENHMARCVERHPSRVFRVGEDMDLATWETVYRVYMDARASNAPDAPLGCRRAIHKGQDMTRARYTLADFRRDIRHPYAWPGGYPRFFVTGDGCALSFDAARQNRRNIIEAFADNDTRGCWAIAGCDVNWEDEALTCDHTNLPIQSAYGDDTP